MAELPTSKPADSFAWPATTNGTSEPSNGLRNAGWAPGDAPPAEEFNWWWQKLGQNLDWLRALAVRRFQTLPEAIAATAPGDVLVLAPAHGALIEASYATMATPSTPRLVACDGAVVITAYDGGGVRADPPVIGTPTALWTASLGVSFFASMSADGLVVALGSDGTAGDALTVLDMTNGNTIYADTSVGAQVGVCVAHSASPSLPRAYWSIKESGTSNVLYAWAGASRISLVTGLRWIRGLAAGGHLLVAAVSSDGTDSALRAWKIYPGSAGAADSLWSVTLTGTSADRGQAVATDGERVYWLINGTIGGAQHRLRCHSGATGAMLWDVILEDISLTQPRRVRVDDRYVYATWMVGIPPSEEEAIGVFCKFTGQILGLLNPGDSISAYVRDFDVDGVHIWLLSDGESMVLRHGTGRHLSTWAREPISQDRPYRRLARCLGGQP
jgi:hypothetical protein